MWPSPRIHFHATMLSHKRKLSVKRSQHYQFWYFRKQICTVCPKTIIQLLWELPRWSMVNGQFSPTSFHEGRRSGGVLYLIRAATKVFKYVDHSPKIWNRVFPNNPWHWQLTWKSLKLKKKKILLTDNSNWVSSKIPNKIQLKYNFQQSEMVKWQKHFQAKPINCGQLGNEERNIKWQCLFGKLPDPSRQYYYSHFLYFY